MYIEVISRKPKSDITHKTTLLFVHGGYQGAWCWDEHFLDYFVKTGFEVHALSLRGHGNSEGHENINQWRLADYVTDLTQVIDKMDTLPILIGHSVGGAVVQKYLEQHSVPAAILLAPSPITGIMAASFKMMLKYPIPYLKMSLTRNMLKGLPMFKDSFFSNDMPKEKVQSYFDRMGNESFNAFMDIVAFDRPQPKNIKTKMLVIGGEYDSSIPRQVNEALASAYGTQLEEFPVAHEMMLDLNWEQVALRIESWIIKLG